ncbi:DinB family protein [Nocardia miyunensis]|uniref:DinB family protein n=1 Tax=Nocardia miyunensis TaxID=282684 RepID=UPI000835CCEF|nr:DinB family protein [Nocardia miyunensis]
MTWTAPEIVRPRQLVVGEERSLLQDRLDYQRATLLWRCRGLTAAQLVIRSVEPSSMSLLGLVRHMTDVERAWFRRRAARQEVVYQHSTEQNQDGEFDDVDTADPVRDFALYRGEIELCDAAVAPLSLDYSFVHPRTGREIGLRWVYLHMIEEYARHNGHADLLRERIDGVTGE